MVHNILLQKQRGQKTLLALAMGSSVLLAACGGGQDSLGGVSAQDAGQRVARNDYSELETKLRNTRLCDLSGCYVAWNVVDSDGDGVCDADEVMAGTNPFDPLSKPSLQVVAELSGKSQLPSFEAGRGAFAVFPAQMQAQLQEYYKGKGAIDQAFAFPLGEARGDSLSRAGIKVDQLKDYGLDPERDGFTIGLDHPTDSGLPARRIGGIDVSLVSAGKVDHLEPLPPSGVPEGKDLGNGDKVWIYPNGDKIFVFKDGGLIHTDAENNPTHVCPPMVDPDADSGATEPTVEQKQAWERLRSATDHIVEGWTTPELSGDLPKDKKPLVILTDPEYAGLAAVMVLTPPLLTSAQPEMRPDLPHPDLPAGSTPVKDLCTVGCVK